MVYTYPRKLARSPAAVTYVNQLIYAAAYERADGICIEPMEYAVRIGFFVGKAFQEKQILPKSMEKVIIPRVKVMTGMNLAEHKKPQNGRTIRRTRLREVDIRVSVIPTCWGESVIMHLVFP